MPSKDKPYRVYRGGRARRPSKPPTLDAELRPPRESAAGAAGAASEERLATGVPGYSGPGPVPRTSRRWRYAVRALLLLVLLFVLVVVGVGVAGYLTVRKGVKEANRRLDLRAAQALAPQTGGVRSSPRTILVLGSDHGDSRGREGSGRADAIVLVRTDPDRHRIALLSIPRDLRVEIPGHGLEKANAAYALGGPALALETVERLTGLPINHVVLVDFASFAEVIDALGGITVDVPERVVSNPFDCPLSTRSACSSWKGWRFEPGRQRMAGRRALVYARIRENQLAPDENDLTRGGRQQQVLQAIADEVARPGNFWRLPSIGDDLVAPLATDLSTSELLQLAWVKYRTPSRGILRCRLGGTPTTIDGVSYLLGVEENVSVVHMVTGDTAPQPPPASGPFGPGCALAA